ncbi:fumarylacetoacetate hydrolase family protein [Paenibacillus xerothermodurans]|uniref:FAA hydrolase family protein n=1 Tax=Paenibacillus xerothermodurans TaxID=1977292 RepID=A0A2W1NNF3_PAEXE|nr:fumarylacetoacetate hydrolase family protein [Paenibacillus xerothermodurans]PZE20985.1 FAA hydrolase family protein [Paenibacillus xerothermodurans]
MLSVRNIYCVGRNYALHAAELGNDIPKQPMIFLKPTHALLPMEGQAIQLPGDQGEVHFEAELVIHVSRPYEEGSTVDELVDKMALGIDLTLRDVQSVIKKKGTPWLPAKGFLNSAPITKFRPFPGFEAIKQAQFSLFRNGEEAQHGKVKDMIFDLQVIIEFIAKNYGLDAGDIIFTGTPAGVAAVHSGDRLELRWGEESAGTVTVELS